MAWRRLPAWRAALAILIGTAGTSPAASGPMLTPSGEALTPLAAPGAAFTPLNPHLAQFPGFVANMAVNAATSPDRRTLLVLTSGFNKLDDGAGKAIPSASGQYVFVFDIANGVPVERQVLHLPNSYMGIAFSPDGRHFYVSGGVDDDVHVFAQAGSGWRETAAPLALGHIVKGHPYNGLGLRVSATAGNLAVTANGARLLVVNFENDSLSLVDLATRSVRDIPLRPGIIDKAQTGVAGGEYPFGIAVAADGTAFVSSVRDREVDVVRLEPSRLGGRVIGRIRVPGNPETILLNRSGTRLFVACDNDGEIAMIDTSRMQVVAELPITPIDARLSGGDSVHGSTPNGLALSPDERRLYVTDGSLNALSVMSVSGRVLHVDGLIPTGFYPDAVSTGPRGAWLYIVNGKSLTGPNSGNCSTSTPDNAKAAACAQHNEYVLQRLGSGLLALPAPALAKLAKLTARVVGNDGLGATPSNEDARIMAALHARIHHIIYIVRENRSYDQILGDLGEGNGDPALTEFGAAITPNAHKLAREFIDFDNFYLPGDVSGDGWQWSVEATEPDIGVRNMPMVYAERGLSYDWEGSNRGILVGLPTLAQRLSADPATPDDPNLLPGINNVAAPDGPQGQFQRGYIWDAALRAGLSIRNYGFYLDLTRYHLPVGRGGIPLKTDPAAGHLQVAWCANPTLAPETDPYFRGFDNNFPDVLREAEWQREFNGYVIHHDLPNLEFVRLMHDHLGNFGTAILGVNTPERQVADNDDALGKLIEAVAHSPYANSTLIFVVEDDAQDGPDHVDAHRSDAFVVGPYVRHHVVVSVRYSTVNMIRTIEDILGFGPMSLLDADQPPMAAAFDLRDAAWDYDAVEPAPLTATQLPQARSSTAHGRWQDARTAAWWAKATSGYDWSREDDIPTAEFDRLLWRGLDMHGAFPANSGPGR